MNPAPPRILLLHSSGSDPTGFSVALAAVAEVETRACGAGERGWRELPSFLRSFRPDAAVALAAPGWEPGFSLWWQTRRHRYAGLRGVYDPGLRPQTGRRYARLVRAGFLDFAATAAGPRSFRTKTVKDAAAAARFVVDRIAAERRSVLWVDPHVSQRSPSMRSLVWSASGLVDLGWELRLLCQETDLPPGLAETVRLPRPPGPPALAMLGFFIACNAWYGWRRFVTGRPLAAVIHTTCANLLAANLASVHFCVPAWLEIAETFPRRGWRERASRVLLHIGARLERLQLTAHSLRLIAPVSPGIGRAVRNHHPVQAKDAPLPNAYDETRFNPQTCARHRPVKRRELGLGDDQWVFAFTSQGHHERKGFWLLVAALDRLPAPWAERARLLVVGGDARQVDLLRARAAREFPGALDRILFVGRQTRVEEWLAAADAFVFPSYFEAFCLAEIEAGALGLPLLLSDHHGVELILREGVNGLRIERDPADIAAKMLALMDGSWRPGERHLGGALDRAGFTRRVDEIYRSLIASSSA